MIVTLNELQRACQKACFGFPTPAGTDDDAALAAVWLESRGLPALRPLVAALDRWEVNGVPDRLVEIENPVGAQRVTASGASAIAVGGALTDLALAAAARAEGVATLTISALRDPEFLVPLAAQRLSDGRCWHILWGDRQRQIAGAALSEKAGIVLLGDCPPLPPETAYEVALTCCRDSALPADGAPAAALDPDELAARRRAALAAGLEVDAALWARLNVYAARALVPASTESRARGAGARSSDND